MRSRAEIGETTRDNRRIGKEERGWIAKGAVSEDLGRKWCEVSVWALCEIWEIGALFDPEHRVSGGRISWLEHTGQTQ
jgi:hypothetical protein